MTTTMTVSTITVRLNRLNITPRKTRLVARLIKGRRANEAEHQLLVMGKRAGDPILKLLRSALAIAKQRELQRERLVVKNITVGDGPKRRKFHAGSRGRAKPIIRRMSNVTLTVSQIEQKRSTKASA